MEAPLALEIHALSKRYGRRVALDGLSLAVPERSVCALVGANGAGKTTTFALIGGFFPANAGEILVHGVPLRQYRRSGGFVGILPQDVQLFESRSVARQLFLLARLSGLSGGAAWREVSRVLELVQLEDRAKEQVQSLSHGMKVRMGVAQALVGTPGLVLLDEPTAGLDPKMVSVFREMIDKLRGSTTILISSHDLSQLELMCDYVCMIDQGRLVKQGALSDLLGSVSQIRYSLDASVDASEKLRKACPAFLFDLGEAQQLTVQFDPRLHRVSEVNRMVLSWLLVEKIGIRSVDSQKTLEQSYLEETKKLGDSET